MYYIVPRLGTARWRLEIVHATQHSQAMVTSLKGTRIFTKLEGKKVQRCLDGSGDLIAQLIAEDLDQGTHIIVEIKGCEI